MPPARSDSLNEALRRAVAVHDDALFRVAYPKSADERAKNERRLRRAAEDVARVLSRGADANLLYDEASSGIARTAITMPLSFDAARWLVSLFPARVSIDDLGDASADRLAALLPRFIPLLREDATAEANVPYADWLEAAAGDLRSPKALAWLLERIAALPGDERDRNERWDALGLFLRFEVGRSDASRTRMRLGDSRTFFFDSYLTRRDVDLRAALAGPRLRTRMLSRREGERALDAARGAMTVRYRELYGFTYADPATGVAADAGRGVTILLFGLPPERRLPLRAAYAFLLVTNGVPVGYGEGFALFERLEISFNVFPAFRGGETAFLLSRAMKLFRERLGSRVFSLDPYQIGNGNEEAIAAGAFWFYRKLGFRPTDARVARLLAREEERLAKRPDARTPASTLRRLAAGPLLFAVDDDHEWDGFHVRNLGLRAAGREDAEARAERALRMAATRPSPAERHAFREMAPALDLIPDLARLTKEERDAIVRIVKAKAGKSEDAYVKALGDVPLLRATWLRFGRLAPRGAA